MPKLTVVSLFAVVVLVVSVSGEVLGQQTAGSDSTAASDKGASARTSGAIPAPTSGGSAAPNGSGASEVAANDARSAREIDEGTYGVRVRDLEQHVNELKEQVFRSKARLSLLAETVLQGVVGGAQTRIVHENRISSSYKLVKVAYALDGTPILNKADEEGVLPQREQFEIYNGSVVPGEHTLSVEIELRGHGHGVFSYLRSYRFKVTSSHTFTAVEGKLTTLRAVSYEQGGPTTPFEQRPAIHYVENVAKPAAPAEVAPGGE